MSGKAERLKDEGSRLQVTAAGATAGLISRFVIAPLDVVKIRLQLQHHSLSDPIIHQRGPEVIGGGPIYKGTLPTMRHILRTEGLTGLWKGNIPAELLYVSYAAVQFTTYRSTTQFLQVSFPKEQNKQLPPSVESFVAGASAGGVATAATYPLDLLRTRFAAQGVERVYPSLYQAIKNIYTAEGVSGYFRGLGPGLGQIIPYMGMFFCVYESLRPTLQNLELPYSSGGAVAGVVAGVVAKTGTFPLDLVRKRIQVQGPTRSLYVHKNIPVYDGGVIKTVGTIIKREGVRGLYRGLTVSLFKAAPASAVTMWTYERALRFYVGLAGAAAGYKEEEKGQ